MSFLSFSISEKKVLFQFLASEAMHHLGVRTTRALSLVVSGKEKVVRPWFSGETPTVDDPRIVHLPLQTRERLIRQFLSSQVC